MISSLKDFGDAHLLAMAESVRLAVFLKREAFPLGAFGKDHQRVVARVVALICRRAGRSSSRD